MQNTAFAHHGLDALYLPFAVHPEHIETAVKALRALAIRGVNVTIPHKQTVMPWLDELAPEARLIGAVNTIHLQDGHLIGYNTDGIGFVRSLAEEGAQVTGQRVLLLGAGGAARAIAVQLCLSGVQQLYVANRTRARAEELAMSLMQSFPHANIRVMAMEEQAFTACLPDLDMVVNATSVGMQPHAGDGEAVRASPLLPSTSLLPRHLVCDIVYHPQATPLLRAAQRQGARTVDGLGMLIHQGAEAFEIWTGRSFPLSLIRAKLLEALAKRTTPGSVPEQA